ncbi:MAG: hypothetical protein D6753_04205 [Planctomycetota bacterium]|nr:MAG: hypothetical protein D6753_04205 [Planctomycetota bacterium]
MRTTIVSMIAVMVFLGASAATGWADDRLVQPRPEADQTAEGFSWYDAQDIGIEGQGWKDVDQPYDRLPAKAKEMVRSAVWELSRDSSGMLVRFKTDATTIAARWSLTSERLAMPHMPATGVSGLDLYVRDQAGRWRWLAVGRPTAFPQNTATLVRGLPAGTREYLLYLPLYNGVLRVEVGVPREAELFAVSPPHDRRPIVFYGTSITHGACASRPGMVHTAILGRRLEYPVVNLGFSGNGRMEIEVGRLMAELDASAYVIDCLPNLTADQVAERTEPLVRVLRQARPDVPILLVEDRTYADAFLVTGKRERNESSRRALRSAYQRLQAAGVSGLHYLEGEGLLGDDGEATVDSSHPTDLGFFRQAAAFEPPLRRMLALP